MKVLRLFGFGLVGLCIVLAALLFGARFGDGPFGIVPGGAFSSGELIDNTTEMDWRFVSDIHTVELQMLEPARSRTTWIIEKDGRIFVPCGYMTTAWGKIWKKWPIEAEKDGRAILRVNDKRYLRHLVRIKKGEVLAGVVQTLADKYAVPATLAAVESGALWIFELENVRH